ncbi:MAG: hypothetical protein KDD62_00890, partial [Bdellovibrionales bacterium]|nr:hypothetical protein [Bdellovibrionales bacterium]
MVKQAYRIVLLLALILSAMVYGFEFPTADFYLQTDGWFYFVHKSFNHYLLWHLDPFSSLLGVANRFVIGSIVSFFGLFLLLYSLRPERLLEAILLSFVFQYSVLHLWGFDTLMVQSTFLLPWLCLALRVCKSEQRKGLLLGSLAALVFAIALCFSALYLAILLVPISFLLVWSLQNWRPGFQELQVRSAPALILFGLLIVVVTAGHSLFPVPHFPSYPSTGHVLTTGSVAGNILPLAAPTAPIPYIDHVSMAALMAPLALILCLA